MKLLLSARRVYLMFYYSCLMCLDTVFKSLGSGYVQKL